jgi:hypothetical protein
MEPNLKQQINELLFQVLNERTTLKEFDEIACSIYKQILDHNDEMTRKE